jgi:hypothetical protein
MSTKIRTSDFTNINVGTAQLSVENNGFRNGGASTLRTVYAGTDSDPAQADFERPSTDIKYNPVLTWGGIPLSLATFYDSSLNDGNPNTTDIIGSYYALDIIKNPNPLDPAYSLDDHPNVVLNGNRLATTKMAGLNYLSIVESTKTIDPSKQIYFMGMPMATNRYNELLVNDTGLPYNDLNEFIELMVGGIPIQIGRMSFKYYLIVRDMDETTQT